VRWERPRQFGACWLGLERGKRRARDRFCEPAREEQQAEGPWSRVAAVLAIKRGCAPGSELAREERWYPSTAREDLVGIPEGKLHPPRRDRCLDRILPPKTKREKPLKQR
jgi:hypothetical protein